jgi:hypothetical protein
LLLLLLHHLLLLSHLHLTACKRKPAQKVSEEAVTDGQLRNTEEIQRE